VGCAAQQPPDPEAGARARQELVARAGAPLFDGMGSYHRPITTRDPGAQRYFDQGMVLAFGFNHAEAIRSFRAAQRLDDQCAMCFWGEALATGPNINVTSKGKAILSPADSVAAHAAAQKALGRRPGDRGRTRPHHGPDRPLQRRPGRRPRPARSGLRDGDGGSVREVPG
jgi:hypothetical protein